MSLRGKTRDIEKLLGRNTWPKKGISQNSKALSWGWKGNNVRYVQYLRVQSKSERERFQSVKKKDEVWVKGIILEEEADVIYSKSKIKNKELWIWFTKSTNIHKNQFTRHCSRSWRYSSKPIKHSLCSHSSGLEL